MTYLLIIWSYYKIRHVSIKSNSGQINHVLLLFSKCLPNPGRARVIKQDKKAVKSIISVFEKRLFDRLLFQISLRIAKYFFRVNRVRECCYTKSTYEKIYI
jgi:hypothetical protein